MNALEEAKQTLLPKLTPREKAELLSLLERETSRVFRVIEKTPLLSNHAGVIVCTQDLDFGRLAQQIHAAIEGEGTLAKRLIRVYRPPTDG